MNMKKKIAIWSTGSIGKSAPNYKNKRINILLLTANQNYKELLKYQNF